MKYGIQCHTDGWFLVRQQGEGLCLISESSASDAGVQLLTFDSVKEAEQNLSSIVKKVGVSGRYEVISLS